MNSMGRQVSNSTGGGIPLNVTLHSWPVPPPEPDTKVTSSDLDTTRHNVTSRIFSLNATSFVALDEDMVEPGFTDAQTLILTSMGTLLTLIVTVGTFLGLRMLWIRLSKRKEKGYQGVMQRDESSGPVREKPVLEELKTCEPLFNGAITEEEVSPTVLTPKSNGSVITMTLKNNHLIVETEETMDTSPSRVESRGSTTTYITNTTIDDASGNGGTSEDHGAIVHRPPYDSIDDDKRSCRTGLSQSDLSISSSGSQNCSYRYGNQVGYEAGAYGYCDTPCEPPPPRPSNSISRELSSFARSSSHLERTDSVVSASDVSTYLRSDITARNNALEVIHQREQAELETKNDKNSALSSDSKPKATPTKEDSNS